MSVNHPDGRVMRSLRILFGSGPALKYSFLSIRHSQAFLMLWITAIILFLLWPVILVPGLPAQWMGASPDGQVKGALALFVVAVLIFRIRQTYLVLYGLIEVVIGLAGCWVVLGTPGDRLTVSMALAGSVYLMVRGFDNYVKGRSTYS